MAKGSNDLNMLLKAQVVKVRAELDVKGSMPKIRQQVDQISKNLEKKPVKLKVKLDFTLKDLTTQLNLISKKISESKTFKNPLRFKVEIDVAGSATKIKKQLQDVYKTVQDFNKKYAEAIKKMQQQQAKFNQQQQQGGGSNKPVNVPTNAPIATFNLKAYAQQVEEAKRLMKSMFGKGNFKSFEMKDAEGSLKGFIGQLEKANGVVQKIQYQWNAQAGKFTPINQQTINSIESHVHKATQQLRNLYSEIEKLQKGAGKSNLLQDYNKLEGKIGSGTLTQDAVKDLQRRIKEEGVLQQQIKQENDLLFQQKKLIADIKRASLSLKDVTKRQQYGTFIQQARKADDVNALREIRLEADKLTQSLKRREQADKEQQRITKERIRLSQELKRLEREISTTGRNADASKQYVATTKAMIQQIRTTQQLEQARRRLASIKDGKWENEMSRKIANEVSKVEDKLRRLQEIGGITQASFSRQMQLLASNSQKSLNDVKRQFEDVSNKVKQKEREMRDQANRVVTLLSGRGQNATVQSKTQLGNIKSAIDTGDIAQLQKYIGQLYKGKVETINMEDKTDKLGRAVTRLQVKMAGTGKTVKTYTVDLDRANNALRQVTSGIDYNANRNLGVFEQLKIAMARVPVWMASMTAFYGTLRGFKAMTREILEVDKALTELKRVASDNINIDYIFQGAVNLAKELGNDIHSIMATLNDFARTFGQFNERQLLAITNTATLMSNVSELSAQEAGETLIGTMNAFGILADESIRIADAFNEVDNNFAVSTKQLAEGMSKTASTAKTFGVSLEESIGHITAISSVTMESGKIIGNSLKTIYSRITTMKDAEEILNSVGIGIRDGITGNVRPVQDILENLGHKWYELTDSQRQNIAVTVAGRYQLSRFLALMNNWQTATDATQTALTSQGSAMKENNRFMESFEARINKLKNAFTEMSLAVGDAFLSGAIFAGIEGLGKLAELATKVASSFGGLPVLMFGIGMLLGLMGTFKGAIGSTVTFLGLLRSAFTMTGASATMFGANMTLTQRVMAVFATLLPTLSAGIRAVGRAFMSVLASTGVGLAFVAVGIVIEKIIGAFQRAKKVAEETEKANKKLIDSYRNTAGGLDNLIAKHEELQTKVDNKEIKEGTDAYNEYLKVNQELAKQMPTMVKFIDSKGVAHMKTRQEMEKEYEIAKKLSEAESGKKLEEYNQKILQRANNIKKLGKEIVDLAKKQKQLEDQDGKLVTAGYGEGQYTYTADNGVKIQQTKIEAINAYQAIQKEIQKMNLQVRDTVLASLEASQRLQHMSDTQRSAVENIIQSNEHFMTDIAEKIANTTDKKELEKLNQQLIDKTNQLFDIGEKVGNMIADKSQELIANATAGLTNPVEIDKVTADIKTNFDNILKALPKTFFSLDSLNDADKFQKKLEGILSVADQIKGGSGNFDGLVSKLTSKDIGFTLEEAKRYVAQLGFEFDNAGIKADVMNQQINGTAEYLGEVLEVALEATDVMENLFGYSSSDVSALKSHIETLQGLKYIYGDNAKENEAWNNSLEILSLRLGLTEDQVVANLPHLKSMTDFISDLKFEYNDAGEIIGINTENMTKAQKKYWDELRHQGLDHATMMDILTGKKVLLANGEVVDTEATKANTEAKDANAEAQKKQAEATDLLAQKFADLKGNMSETTKSAYIDTIAQQLGELDGKIVVTKDEAGNLKLAMADGSESGYLSALQKQLEELGIKIGLVQDDSGNLKVVLNDGTGSTTLTTIDKNAKDAKLALDETITSVDVLNEKKILPNDYSEIDFTKLSKGIEDTTGKVQLLSEALQGTAQNTQALSSIEGALQALKQLASDIKNYIGSTLDGAKGDLGELAKKAEEAKRKIDDLKTALENIKSDSKKISLTGVKDLRKDVDEAIQSIGRLRGRFSEISTSAKDSASGVKSASGKIKDAVKDAEKAMDKIGDSAKETKGELKSAFTDASKTVSSKTSSMVNNHNTQRTAINKLADSARIAKNAISDMMKFASNSMGALDRYIAKANQAKSAGNGVPKTPSGLFGGFGLGNDNVSSEGVASAMSTFSASTEGAVGGSGSGTGASGTIVPSIYEGGLYFDGHYMMNAFELQDLVNPNYNQREITAYGGVLAQIEAMMQRIDKATASYRDKLQSVVYYQNVILKLQQKELANTDARQSYILKRLKELSNTSKHSEAQREEYNNLQNEYEQNLSKIAGLKAEIENIITDIKNKSLEIFTDFIDEIVGKYDDALKAIQSKTDDVQFKLDILAIVDQDNVEEQLKLLAEKASLLGQEEATSKNKLNAMKSQYSSAVSKYGSNSAEAKKAKEELDKAEEAWEDAYLKLIQSEKEIKDVRGKVADDGIKELKDYYGKMKDMALKAIDIEKRELQKAHDSKMKMYDEEISKITSVYDAKLKSMDEEKSQSEYQEQLDEKNMKKAELLNKISLLSRDNSLEGRKKLEELKKELADAEKDIAKFMKDRQDELLRKSIEEQKQAQLDSLNAQKEVEQEKFDSRNEELDAEKEDITKNYDDMINNEKYWADMRNEFISGSFEALTSELGAMSQQLDQMSKGNFDNLTNNFYQFSDAVKQEFADMQELGIANMMLSSGSVVGQVGQVGNTTYNPYTGTGTVISTPAVQTPAPAPAPAPAPTPSTPAQQASGWDSIGLAKGSYATPRGGWNNASVVDRMKKRGYDASIANRAKLFYHWGGSGTYTGTSSQNQWLLSKMNANGFKTGGYTGSWIGDQGKLTMVHPEEYILNKKQTKGVVEIDKFLDKVKNILPDVKRSSLANKLEAVQGINVTNNYELTVNIDKVTGDKDGANVVIKEVMKGLKKMGK